MDRFRLLFFAVACITLCNHGAYATDWREFVLFGSRVPFDREVGTFNHEAGRKLLSYTTMRHKYLFFEEECVFSHVSIENLADPNFGGDVFMIDGGIGSDHIVIETQGRGSRPFHVDIKLYGYNMLDYSKKCTVQEIKYLSTR